MNSLKHISEVKGRLRAMAVIERMMQNAPTAEERRKQLGLMAGIYDPRDCLLCDGVGFLEVKDNVVRKCDCRLESSITAKRKEHERERSNKELVDFLFEGDDP